MRKGFRILPLVVISFAVCALPVCFAGTSTNILVGRIDTPGPFRRLALQESYAYVASDVGLDIIDIHDRAHPSFVSRYGTKVREVAANANFVFVLDWDDGLAALDVSNPHAPRRVAANSSLGLISSSMALYNGYCYIANGNSGLEIVDVRDPAAGLRLVTTRTYGGIRVDHATISDGKLFAFSDHIIAYNLGDPANPALIGANNILGHELAISGRYLFEAAREGFSIYEVANFSRPILVSNVPFAFFADAIALTDRVAYVGDQTAGTQIFDCANVFRPRLMADMPNVLTQQIITTPDYAYVVDQSGLAIFHLVKSSPVVWFEPLHLSDPTQPSIRIYGPQGVAGRIEQTADFESWEMVETVTLPGDLPVVFTPTVSQDSKRVFFRFVSP